MISSSFPRSADFFLFIKSFHEKTNKNFGERLGVTFQIHSITAKAGAVTEMAEKRRKKSRDDDEDDDYGGEEEEYMPLDEVDEEEEEKSKRRGRKRKSEECRVQPKKAKSAARAKGKQKAKGSEEDEDEDYGVEAEEADTRPAKKARSPAKPKATTATKKGATPAPQPGGAKPTTSEDFFKRKDFVNHYYSAVWTLEKKAKDSKEKTTVTEEGSSAAAQLGTYRRDQSILTPSCGRGGMGTPGRLHHHRMGPPDASEHERQARG